jgi:hypothetical protein
MRLRKLFAVSVNLSNSTAMLITLQVGLSYALTVALCFQRLERAQYIRERIFFTSLYDFSKAMSSIGSASIWGGARFLLARPFLWVGDGLCATGPP